MDMAADDEQTQIALALSLEAASRRRGRFTKKLRAFTAGRLGGSVFDGNQIRLPPTVMSEIFEDNPQGEHVYQIRTMRDCLVFVGVIDYACPDSGRCVLSLTVMKRLGIEDDSLVELTLVNATSKMGPMKALPVVTQLRLRWQDCSEYNEVWALPDAEVFAIQKSLEATLDSNFPVITLEDLVQFQHGNKRFSMLVLSLRKRSDSTEPSEEVDLDVFDSAEVLRLRVPAWEAFDRKLLIEPPLDWIPPKPFTDAVWDESRRMYYPAGWEWDEATQEYALPPTPPVPLAQRARSEQVPPTEHDFGAGQALGGATATATDAAERRPLTQEELRQQRLKAMEERMAKINDSSPAPPGPTSSESSDLKKTAAGPSLQGGRGVRMSMKDLQVRTFHVGGKEGWQARRDITVEVVSTTVTDYFQSFRKSGWACKWAMLYGRVTSEGTSSAGLPKATVHVEAVWEPPQHASDEAFGCNKLGVGRPPRLLRAPIATDAVEIAAEAAGLCRVGWLFTCPPREKDFTFRAEEALHAAYLQLECANGYMDGEPPFVTLRMSITVPESGAGEISQSVPQGLDEHPELELTAWCATQQAMEMRAKGFLETGTAAARYRDAAKVAEGFRVIQEGRETGDVDVTFLHRPLPIVQVPQTGPALNLYAVVENVEPQVSQEEIEYEQVTKWAPPEIKSQFRFLGEGHRLVADPQDACKRQHSNEAMPASMQPVLRKTMSAAIITECGKAVDESLEIMASGEMHAQIECCRTLLRLFDNVMAQPEDPKFRKLNKNNKTLNSKVFSLSGSDELLLASGWNLDAETYLLAPEAALPLIDFVSNRLREHVATLERGHPSDGNGAVKQSDSLAVSKPTETSEPDTLLEQLKWSCSVCTLINPASRTTCDACGTVKS